MSKNKLADELTIRKAECEAAFSVLFELRDDCIALRKLLKEIGSSAIEFQDKRVNYLLVQIDKDVWEKILKESGLKP